MAAFAFTDRAPSSRTEEIELNRWEDEGGTVVEQDEEAPRASTGFSLGRCANLLFAANLLESGAAAREVAAIHSLHA